MIKRLLLLTVIAFSLQLSAAFSQISIGTVDPGPYANGSNIASTFTLGTQCIRPGNRFNLYLVYPNGTERIIGFYDSFYGTFVNGLIPSQTIAPPAAGYRLRIKSTSPVFTSNDSAPFEILAGTPVSAGVRSFPELKNDINGSPEVFGNCPGVNNAEFTFTNISTPNSIVTGTVRNEITGSYESPLIFSGIPPDPGFNAALAHYTVFITSKLNGITGTRAYLVVNNTINNSFGTTGGNIVCLPGGYLEYTVNLGEQGIKNNFPGTTYQIKWGDGNNTAEVFTICDLSPGYVRHEYTQSSCGQPVYNTGSGNQYNVFGINIAAVSPFCQDAGAGISTYVRVVTKPINSISAPAAACTGSFVNFINASIAGQSEANTPSCVDNSIRYNWYLDGVRMLSNVDRSVVYRPQFLTPGTYQIRLESVKNGQCNGAPVTHEICIQNPPQVAFDFNNATQTGCAPFTIQAFDRSVIDSRCNTANRYNWIVTPSANVEFNASDKNPIFKFNNPGTYRIELEIITASCGAVRSGEPQTIILVDGTPTAQLSNDITICNTGTLPFSPTATITKTSFSGTQQTLPNFTYTWSVTESSGAPLQPGDFSFENGTNEHSQYPSIKFNAFKRYRIKVVHQNTCGTAEDEQLITFLESPSPSITVNPNPICFNAQATLSGSISNNNFLSYAWSTPPGGGTFLNGNTLNPTYIPSATDRANLSATVMLTISTGLAGECQFVTTSAQLNIFPDNLSTNPAASRSQTICTGVAATFSPASSVSGSTFRWTAMVTQGNATGFSESGVGDINETLNNPNPTQDAVVVYTIIPEANGCDGQPFTFTVTVTPKPILTATTTTPFICSNSITGITLSSNLPHTFYTWTSTVTGNIVGNSNPSTTTSTTSIPDVIINNGTTQGSVTYVVTPVSENGCPGSPVTVMIQVDPAVTVANAGTSGNICDDNSYTLDGNVAIVGIGKWTQVGTIPNVVTFDDDTFAKTRVTGLNPGQVYTFQWTITAGGACQPSSSRVTITVNEPTIPGTLSGAATVCQGLNNGQLALTGHRGNILRWESSVDNGTTWTIISNNTANLNYTNLTQTTQYRAIIQNGSCDPKESNITTITVTPAGTTAFAGPAQTLCGQTATTTVSAILTGNSPQGAENGLWTIEPANSAVIIENPAGPSTRVSGLLPGQTYVFLWTITSTSACEPSSSRVNVQILLPIENNNLSSSSALVCSGRIVDIVGSLPTGGTGIYQYFWERSIDNGTTWTPILNATQKDLLNYTVLETTLFRRNVNSGSCSLVSNEYTITAQPPISNNAVSAGQTICSGLAPLELIGTLPTGGDGLFRYQWQSSADGNSWVNIPGALSQNYQPPILTALSHYRRIVTTAACDGVLQNVSNAVIITVNPNAEAEFTYAFQTGCAPFALDITATPYADRNATYTWYANNNVIGTGIDFPGYTITESNTTATIRLVVTSSLGCTSDEQSTVFSTNQAVPASFNQSTSSGCGPLAVNFVNTSVLTGGATFVWDFGNGQTSTQANPPTVTYLAEPTGKDTTYVVTLTATTSCGTDVRTSTVLVKAQPIAVFSPSRTDGCSPMTVSFTNTSPGSTNTYYYDFGDGSPVLETTDKGPVQHVYTTTTVQLFRARLTVVNECGTDFREYNIRVAPQNITPELVVDATQKEGCAPLLVNFDNNSTGATRFTFDFGDGGTLNTVAPGRVQHTYTRPGTYTVTMTAYNSCSEIATTETITVLPQPVAAFEADVTLGCPGLPVQFRNTTQDGFSYLWDFGDGTTSDEFEPRHLYSGDQEYYTVTLTATNTLGCSISVIRNQYIHVVQPPVARFNVDPSVVIDIPNYTFRFIDESTGSPTNWAWDFGDGTNSSLQSPSHTYPDTGTYRVTLRVMNQQGCFTTTFKDVTIKGVPGYLFVPNSFIPGSPMPELREFRAKGSGMETYKLSIFNKWGELLWETTKLEEGRPAEGWDGTFKGSPMPQGVYFWKMEVKMINGTEWKGMTYDSSPPRRTGPIHLIR